MSALGWAIGCGGISELVDNTVATLTPVRSNAQLVDADGAERDSAVVSRISLGETVRTPAGGLARLSLDAGPRLLLDDETDVALLDGASVRLEAGRVFAEASAAEQLEIVTATGSLRASDASLSLRVEDGAAHLYVIRGEVAFTHGDERGIAISGEELALSEASVTRTASVLWQDWTGGLARPGPSDASGPEGVGLLEARVPDEVGQARWPLVVRRLDVRVRIENDLAITEVDQLFFNPASEMVEGLYRVRVPEGAVLQRFSVDREDRLVDGYVRERAQARQAYEAQVYRGSQEDPALLEWDAPGAYRARIYPIRPGQTRRIVIRYAEWLGRPSRSGEGDPTPRLYRYPMGGGARAPHIQEFSLSADVADAGAERVRAGMGATVEEGAVRIRRSDFVPRSDFWLELVGPAATTQTAWRAPHEPPPRAPDARAIPNEADERDYFYLPLVLPTSLATSESDVPLDVVVIADVSAATDRTHLELGRAVAESLTAQLRPTDRVAVLSADLTIRSVIDGEEPALHEATPEHVEALLDGLARVPAGGATDLGEAIAAAAGLLDPSRHGAVIYVGDGAPTVGELRADGLLERLGRLPEPVRLYAVAVGSDANLELLETLTRGGGLAMRVEERAEAADAALRVLAHAVRPIAHHVEVVLGDAIENSYPRRPMDAVLGEVFPVVGRVRDTLPTEVTVRGTIAGEAFEETIAISPQDTRESTDLRLRWAQERLRQMLLEGAGREEVAELGTRYGLITPFTSYYVPSQSELNRMGPYALQWIDQPLLRIGNRRPSPVVEGTIAIALGPFALMGCNSLSGSDEAASAPAAEFEMAEEDTSRGEGMMAREQAAPGGTAANSATTAPTPSTIAPATPADGPPAEVVPMAEPSPDEPAARAMDRAADVGVMGALDATDDDGEFGENVALGNDPMDAIGALMGDQIGDNFGNGGLGLRGTGRGGGGEGEGTIGLGNLGTIGHGAGGGSASGYGRGAGGDTGYGGGLRGRSAGVPRVRTGEADVRGALSREVIRRIIRRHINEVRFCYEQELNQRPDLAGRVSIAFIISPTGSVQSSSVASSTLGDARVEQCIAQAVQRWQFPQPDGGGIVGVNYPFVLDYEGSGGGDIALGGPARNDASEAQIVTRIVHVQDAAAHERRRCSDAAALPLSDRTALWRERLGAQSNASAWIQTYRDAARECEATAWRDRRALLEVILSRAGSVDGMLNVYRLLDDSAARAFVRAQVLRRVRTPEDLRAVRNSFGLGSGVDQSLVEQILERAPNDAAKIRALRRLSVQYPDSFELKLRLLSMLERTDRDSEAKRLADQMRADPLADPGVRTAIGEMFLRMERPEEARRVFSEIVEFAPLDELARRRLGDLYRAHGWFEDAYRQYQTLSEIRPDDASVLLLLAQAAAGAGRVDEALRLEQRLMQTAQPGESTGVARTALLWSSVRFARLRSEARAAGDEERLDQLRRRMNRAGVLREAHPLRATLVWSHPDAQVALWAGFPGLSPTRPMDITPEYGIEAFDLEEQEDGVYTLEVRRTASDDDLNEVRAQLVVVWNEGGEDEQIQITDLVFDPDHDRYAWTISGRTLAETHR
ncbi:MAG: TonB family protein [Sandaracinaceae bacterium]